MGEGTRARIRLLDDVTASRIAAGEVVERPASVVKELVENALDAGARDVRVEIVAGGRRLIRVTDDGEGIPADQVALAVTRHATSKIATADDLVHVRSLGFRGEALAAIAAVSHLTLTSRTADSPAGVALRVTDGRPAEPRVVGAPVGTQVTVENLFSAVPARLKFLRTDQTESGHVLSLVSRYAMAHPDRRFALRRDGREVFRTGGSGDLQDALAATFGLETARQMLPLSPAAPVVLAAEDAGGRGAVRVSGYTSPPHVHRATRRDISLFVNGRLVQDTQLSFAVVQAYHTLLPAGRYPLAIVMVALPASQVDVNVHPAKTEVRFRDARAVFAAVQRTIRQALNSGAGVPSLREAPGGSAWSRPWQTPPAGPPAGAWAPASPGAETGPPAGPGAQTGPPAGPDATSGRTSLDALPVLRVLGQYALSYIVAEGPDGIYFVDQHAAHERVMYEEMMSRLGRPARQRLLEPVSVALTPVQAGLAHEAAPALSAIGWEVEPFGGETVLVRAMPEVLAAGDVADTLRTVLDLAAEGGAPVDEAMEARLVRAVCKRATVKAGQRLAEEEMRSLLRRLEATTSPRTCPHGRPTVVVLLRAEVTRAFGRH